MRVRLLCRSSSLVRWSVLNYLKKLPYFHSLILLPWNSTTIFCISLSNFYILPRSTVSLTSFSREIKCSYEGLTSSSFYFSDSISLASPDYDSDSIASLGWRFSTSLLAVTFFAFFPVSILFLRISSAFWMAEHSFLDFAPLL